MWPEHQQLHQRMEDANMYSKLQNLLLAVVFLSSSLFGSLSPPCPPLTEKDPAPISGVCFFEHIGHFNFLPPLERILSMHLWHIVWSHGKVLGTLAVVL